MTDPTQSDDRSVRGLPRAVDPGGDATARRDASTAPTRRRMPRKHVIMLMLAAEVLVMGWRCSDRYRPPGIVVDATFTEGNEIT